MIAGKNRAHIKILKSSVGFDYAKRFQDCHCEGEARSNLQLTEIDIASSFHSSQWHAWIVRMWARGMNESDRTFENCSNRLSFSEGTFIPKGNLSSMFQHPRLRLHRKIEKLKSIILAIGTEVEENIHLSIRAMKTLDKDLASRVVEADRAIDRMGIDLEEECLEILALHQPVASDLRFIVGIFKMNQNLERMGDMAANIARNAFDLSNEQPVSIPQSYFVMSEDVVRTVKRSLDAFVNLDTQKAYEVLVEDDRIDLQKHQLHSDFVQRLAREPEKARQLILLFLVSRHLERIGDHATNIAEDVVYMVTGEVSP